jgi:cell division protein FtsX
MFEGGGRVQKINPPIAFAWGVLGSAIAGSVSPYSHVVFRSSYDMRTQIGQKSFLIFFFF